MICNQNINIKHWYLIICLAIALGLSLFSAISHSKSWKELSENQQDKLSIPVHGSKLIEFEKRIKKISVANPAIADIVIIDQRKLYILGKGLGSTNLFIMESENKVMASIYLEIIPDLQALRKNLYQLMPAEPINIHASKGSIIISGQVSSITQAQAAVSMAESFLPASEALEESEGGNNEQQLKVINLLSVSGAQQIMLEVKVAEISRQVMKTLDFNFNLIKPGSDIAIGAVNGGASFPDAVFKPGDIRTPVFEGTSGTQNTAPFGPVIDEFMPNDLSILDKGLFLSFLNKNLLFNAVLEIAKENGLAKILAEPTLTTQSGQNARFISGGEVPIPVPRGSQGVTIDYKEYGVGVEFTPVVLNANRINLDLNITVSEITDTFSFVLGEDSTRSNFFIPGLSKRNVQTTVELSDGQTLGIAGLIKENLRESVKKIPGLGDLPVLGPMFRSQEFIKGQTELVIFVTPHFAKPINQDEVILPTDFFTEPTDYEFYMLGRTQGRNREEAVHSENYQHPLNRTFGHEL